MPASEGTLTAADVAADLGVPPDDPRLTRDTDAARLYAEVHRHNPDGMWYDADVHKGGVQLASALYLGRVTPEGMAGYDPSIGGVDTFSIMWRATKFLRLDVGFA